MTDSQQYERNIRGYPWYAALYNAFFWMPVFFLYFSEHLALGEVLGLEAIYYAGVVVFEVPSGYFSDRYGRRRTLLLSSAFLVAAYNVFAVAETFAVFAVAQLLLAGGIAFQSGTGTSFHYDSLAAAGREGEYEEREGIVERNRLAASALAAVAGGAGAAYDLRLAYVFSAVAALGALIVVARFDEPEAADDESPPGFGRQLRAIAGEIRRPALAWLFAYAVVMTVLNHVPYEFYQPYIELVGRDMGMAEGAPLATGLHMGVTTLLGAAVARRGVELNDWIGTGPTLLVATAVQLVVIASMAVILHPLLVLLIVLRGLPKAIAAAPFRAAVTPRLAKSRRATYLSVQSLAGRLSFAGVLAGLAAFAGTASPENWEVLSTLLGAAAILAGVAIVGLAVGLLRVDLSEQ